MDVDGFNTDNFSLSNLSKEYSSLLNDLEDFAKAAYELDKSSVASTAMSEVLDSIEEYEYNDDKYAFQASRIENRLLIT